MCLFHRTMSLRLRNLLRVFLEEFELTWIQCDRKDVDAIHPTMYRSGLGKSLNNHDVNFLSKTYTVDQAYASIEDWAV